MQHPSVIDERIEHVAVVMAMTRRIKEASEGGDDDDFDWTEGERTPPPSSPVSIHRDHDRSRPAAGCSHSRPDIQRREAVLLAPPWLLRASIQKNTSSGSFNSSDARRRAVPHPDPDLETAPLLAGSGSPSQEKRRKTWR